jgi:cytochrome c-type biogenesis protein CcmF
MIPELGQFALVVALICAIVQAGLPIIGNVTRIPNLLAVARPAAHAQFLSLSVAFACLIYAFVSSDFSVAYVAQNSNTALPLLYKVSAVWGAHEGSLLLWALTLGLWTFAVSLFSRQVPNLMLARVLSIMGWISVGFLLFLIITSNPFERLLPAATQGRDLNPLLQDPGLAIHPPMLYMGYVGFSVAFAFAIAALWGGQLDAAWARWSRPWTNIAWIFLTLGITLGSWWAYYELGWGGWWFWDPVENASFMPWLVGTALIHSLAVTDKRSSFKAWTALLAIFAFSLSLLGTFLVRSGVLVSVHAFANDSERGVFILIFLAIVVGGSLLLYAWRAPTIKSHGRFALLSRETTLLLNNVFLVVLAVCILGGTLFPIITVALELGKYSVGAPYFNFIFILLAVPLAVIVGIGQLLRWKQDSAQRLLTPIAIQFCLSILLALLTVALLPGFSGYALLGMSLAWWIAISTLYSFIQRFKNQSLSLSALNKTPPGYYGSHLAHLGVMVFCIGITLTSVYSDKKDVLLEPGASYQLNAFNYTFQGASPVNGPNYRGYEGTIIVSKNNEHVVTLNPQKRFYFSQQNPMTEAAIDAGISRDLFVALGEQRGQQGAWTLRLYHKPFIRWIWFGAVLMALGGLVASLDRRYRRVKFPSHKKIVGNNEELA